MIPRSITHNMLCADILSVWHYQYVNNVEQNEKWTHLSNGSLRPKAAVHSYPETCRQAGKFHGSNCTSPNFYKYVRPWDRRNTNGLPVNFMFKLSMKGWHFLRSRNVILEKQGRGKYSKYRPYVFTEQGVAMYQEY